MLQRLMLFLLLFSAQGLKAQNIQGEWMISNLIIDSVTQEYRLKPLSKEKWGNFGNHLVLTDSSIFYSYYNAPCGNDCFISSRGKYILRDENHIQIIIDTVSYDGECSEQRSEYAFPMDIGLYYIHRRNDQIYLVKSEGIAKDSAMYGRFYGSIDTSYTENEQFRNQLDWEKSGMVFKYKILESYRTMVYCQESKSLDLLPSSNNYSDSSIAIDDSMYCEFILKYIEVDGYEVEKILTHCGNDSFGNNLCEVLTNKCLAFNSTYNLGSSTEITQFGDNFIVIQHSLITGPNNDIRFFFERKKKLKKVIKNNSSESVDIIFRDTISDFVFDSVYHNVGIAKSDQSSVLVTKHFKYIGTDTLIIQRTRTNDPHFIHSYPQEPLIPNKVYSFKAQFPYRNCTMLNENCHYEHSMGFVFYDIRKGEKSEIYLKFKVEYESLNNKIE